MSGTDARERVLLEIQYRVSVTVFQDAFGIFVFKLNKIAFRFFLIITLFMSFQVV